MSKLTWFGLAFIAIALWLLADIGWRAALGVFVFVWGNNLIYTARMKHYVNDMTRVLR